MARGKAEGKMIDRLEQGEPTLTEDALTGLFIGHTADGDVTFIASSNWLNAASSPLPRTGTSGGVATMRSPANPSLWPTTRWC